MAKSLTQDQTASRWQSGYSNPAPFHSRVMSFLLQGSFESFHASVYAIGLQNTVEEISGKEGNAGLIHSSLKCASGNTSLPNNVSLC